MLQRAGERPRQRRRRGLVAADQQRHQVVAQLVVVERGAVVVAGVDQERQDVGRGAALVGGQRAAARDLVEEDGVDGADAIGDFCSGRREGVRPGARACDAARAEEVAHARAGKHQRRAVEPGRHDGVEILDDESAEQRHARPFGDAEDRAQDHAQRHLLQLLVQDARLAVAPVAEDVVGDGGHVVAVGAHALAVEGRHHQPPRLLVRRVLLEDDRVIAEEEADGLASRRKSS